MSKSTASSYNAAYYLSGCGKDYNDRAYWAPVFRKIAQNIVDQYAPKTFLDVGCAYGYLVENLRDLGVEAYGVDISEYAISQVREDIRPYCRVCNAAQGLPADLPRRYDCVSTIEVIEHLYEEDAQAFLHTVCGASDRVIFSSTPDDVEEPTHVNVQQPEYWAKRFVREGMYRCVGASDLGISPQTMIFERTELNPERLVEQYEHQLRLVHSDLSADIANKENYIQGITGYLKEAQTGRDSAENRLKASEVCVDRLRRKYIRLEEEKSLLDGQMDELGRNFRTALAELEGRRQHEKDLELAYQAVTQSFFWRATWPLRYLVSKSKRVLRAVPGVRKGYALAACLKDNGVSGTKAVLAQRRARRGEAAEKQRLFPGASLDPEMFAPLGELLAQCRAQQQGPKISILVPLYNTPEPFLTEMIDSVRNQTYRNWQLCLADASDAQHASVGETAKRAAAGDSRIVYRCLTANEGIAGNTNAAAGMADGEYIALLDHDDVLYPNALFEVAAKITGEGADVVYTDEMHLRNGALCMPLCKPDWSPDLLYSQNYVCHLLVFRRSLTDEVVFRSEYDGAQDHDLILRLSERAQRICHVPKFLYAWREHAQSTAANADSKPYANEAGRRAVEDHLKRKYGPTAYAENGRYGFTYVPRFPFAQNAPKVSIIIPFKDKAEMTDACVRSILRKTKYPSYEILLLNNRSEEDETRRWMEQIAQTPRVRVLDADFSFNWSRLNNFGAEHADGDVFVFLNNDTRVITEDWLQLIAENAMRPDVGVVGALLLYPDSTIQHAGVVVGMNGWADHVFKGRPVAHTFSPFISPVLTRDVTAVTGACQGVSRAVFESLNGFDENFIICGSDVELCLRARDAGLWIVYDAQVRLYHDESKSRSSYVPENDFDMSKAAYASVWATGDPYYNPQLDLSDTTPKLAGAAAPQGGALAAEPIREEQMVGETRPMAVRADETVKDAVRVNLIVPSVREEHVFGGISTALKFYQRMADELGCPMRIVLVDFDARESDALRLGGYELVEWDEESKARRQIVNMVKRSSGETLCVGANDVFIATAWWTAYIARGILKWQKDTFGKENKLVYLIQDYEPYFYAWSSRYSMAEYTYHMDVPTAAVFNSTLLKEYFDQRGYTFCESYCFDAVMNANLFAALDTEKEYPRKKQIIFYGRPGTPRNCFEIAVKALGIWSKMQPDAADWTVYSVGEPHAPIVLDSGLRIESLGKLSLSGYAKLMQETYAGISLMVSPHPSYPPLEMSTFGIRTLTNCYANKDLTGFNDNIVSLRSCAPEDVARALCEVCDDYTPVRKASVNPSYCSDHDMWQDILPELCRNWKELQSKGRE